MAWHGVPQVTEFLRKEFLTIKSQQKLLTFRLPRFLICSKSITTKFFTIQSQRTNKFPIRYIVRIPLPPFRKWGGRIDSSNLAIRVGMKYFLLEREGLLRTGGFFTFILNFHKKEEYENDFQFG